MATLKETVAAFQALNATIAGIAYAPDPTAYPPTLLSSQMPAAITLPGPARWYGQGGMGAQRKAQRTYVVSVYIQVASPGVAQPFSLALDLMEAMGATYANTAYVNAAMVEAGGVNVTYTANDGLGDLGFLKTLAYGGETYYGFTFHIPALEQR
jgi:hypothetical protein